MAKLIEHAVGHAARKRGPGRPGLEEAKKIKREREAAEAAKRAKNPLKRSFKTNPRQTRQRRCDVLMRV